MQGFRLFQNIRFRDADNRDADFRDTLSNHGISYFYGFHAGQSLLRHFKYLD